jgi:hypothetical protein
MHTGLHPCLSVIKTHLPVDIPPQSPIPRPDHPQRRLDRKAHIPIPSIPNKPAVRLPCPHAIPPGIPPHVSGQSPQPPPREIRVNWLKVGWKPQKSWLLALTPTLKAGYFRLNPGYFGLNPVKACKRHPISRRLAFRRPNAGNGSGMGVGRLRVQLLMLRTGFGIAVAAGQPQTSEIEGQRLQLLRLTADIRPAVQIALGPHP